MVCNTCFGPTGRLAQSVSVPTVMDDAILMQRLASGDDDALAPIIKKYGPYLESLVARYVGRHTAEEVVQDTFMVVREKANQFRKDGSLKPWLTTIALRRGLDALRKQRRRLWLELSDSHPVSVPPGHETETKEVADKINHILDRLDDDSRRVLWLYYFDDLTYEDIAKELQIPLGTVKSRMHTAKKRMADALGDLSVLF